MFLIHLLLLFFTFLTCFLMERKCVHLAVVSVTQNGCFLNVILSTWRFVLWISKTATILTIWSSLYLYLVCFAFICCDNNVCYQSTGILFPRGFRQPFKTKLILVMWTACTLGTYYTLITIIRFHWIWQLSVAGLFASSSVKYPQSVEWDKQGQIKPQSA